MPSKPKEQPEPKTTRKYKTRGRSSKSNRERIAAISRKNLEKARIARENMARDQRGLPPRVSLEEIRKQVEALVAESTEAAKARQLAQRPKTVIEYCQANGLPEDIVYHPRYNAIGVDPSVGDQALEGICFARGWPSELGGLGGYQHLRNFMEMTWPDIEWNPWLEMCMRALTDDESAIRIGNTVVRFVNFVGAGSSGKTFAAGMFGAAWFITDIAGGYEPRSSVTLTSTSKGIIAQRVWPVIQKAFHTAKIAANGQKMVWGHMIDSKKTVCSIRGDGTKDEKHSICALAVGAGDLAKSLDRIKGRHTERMMLIVDEANSTPMAIFECIPNMLTSVRELIVLVIGNAGSRLDPHGLCCEPRRGWKSVTIEDTQWETKGVAKWGIGPGICIHFDAQKSPNVIAGRTEHKHIYSFERWQQVERMGPEYKNTLQHWSQDRGFWPPDGIQTTIFSEAMVVQHDGMGEHHWLSEPRPCAALDPAFGGDDCQLQFGLLGHIIGGRMGLQLTEHSLVPFDPKSPDAVDFQIAKYVIAQCKLRGIEPNMFGLDATGTGRGVAAFVRQMWSNRIHAVEFGGAASDLPASTDDPRESHEVYANRVTELWYSCRDVLLADQLKGLYQEVITQACSRVYSFVNKRYQVEKKEDMKLRLGYSPDAMDAGVVLVDVARNNGLVAKPFTVQEKLLVRAERQEALDSLYENAYGQPYAVQQYADVE